MATEPVFSGSIPGNTIQQDSVLPKYFQLKHILRQFINTLQPDEPVPSEAELCQQYGVSRTTVRKALSDLAQEGLLYTIQGKGTFVSASKKASGWVAQSGGFFADMTERGFTITMNVLELAVVPAEGGIPAELGIPEGEPVVKLVRLRSVDGKSFDIVTNYMPSRRFPGLEKEDFSATSLYTILKTRYGVKFASGVRKIEACICTPEEARLIQIPVNSALLVMRSTMFDDAGRAIEHGIVHQRSDLAQIIINVIPH
jgi:GntR family transcriptional regulator